MLIGNFSAQGVDGGYQTQDVQLGGVELLRDGVQAGGNFGGYLGDVMELIAGMRRKARNILLELAKADLEEGHALTQIVV